MPHIPRAVCVHSTHAHGDRGGMSGRYVKVQGPTSLHFLIYPDAPVDMKGGAASAYGEAEETERRTTPDRPTGQAPGALAS